MQGGEAELDLDDDDLVEWGVVWEDPPRSQPTTAGIGWVEREWSRRKRLAALNDLFATLFEGRLTLACVKERHDAPELDRLQDLCGRLLRDLAELEWLEGFGRTDLDAGGSAQAAVADLLFERLRECRKELDQLRRQLGPAGDAEEGGAGDDLGRLGDVCERLSEGASRLAALV